MKNYIFKKLVIPKVVSAPKQIRKTFVFFIYLGFGPLLWTEYQLRQGRLILGIEDEVTVGDIFDFDQRPQKR